MKQKNGFDFGRMVFGCVLVAFVSVFVWFMSDALFTPSLKGYETVPCRIVKSSVKMEKVNRFIFTAEFALAGLFLIGVLICKIVRELRAPRLVLTLSCAMWKHGSPAQVDWSLDNPEEIESLEIVRERTKMEGSGKYRRLTTVSSQSCSRHAQSMIPGAGSFSFMVPGSTNDGCNLSFVAKVKVKGVSHVFTLTHLPVAESSCLKR